MNGTTFILPHGFMCDCFECTSPPEARALNHVNFADTAEKVLRAKVPVKLYASPSETAKVYHTIKKDGVIGSKQSAGLLRSTPKGWLNTTFGWIKDDPSTYYEGTIDLSNVSSTTKISALKAIVEGNSSGSVVGAAPLIETGESVAEGVEFLKDYWKWIVGAVILILVLILAIKIS